ncbi:MAG TPA: hypothetical protein VE091_11810 [Gemmatimonadales bacterium]|nr:hypothetical protein [Gemmatimonadales bacterium]
MGDLIPLAGMFTGLLITVAAIWGTVRVVHGPLGQALAHRLRGRGASDADLSGEMAQLRDQVDQLRRELEETQERVDFAERLLSQRPPAAAISGPEEHG